MNIIKITCSLLTIFVVGCKSYSRYSIDEKPQIKIDSGLLGTWKALEDTDKANFILVQSPYDLFHSIEKWHNMDSAGKRKAIYESMTHNGVTDTERVKFMMEGIADKDDAEYYEHYYKFLAENNSNYYITYFDHHGINPHYQQWTAYHSNVKNERFLNIEYRYVPYVNDQFIRAEETEGYFFVRLIKINATYDTLTTAIIADTTLKSLTSNKRIRKRIDQNIDNPAFYSDTVHFYKENGYHLSLKEAVEKAN